MKVLKFLAGKKFTLVLCSDKDFKGAIVDLKPREQSLYKYKM